MTGGGDILLGQRWIFFYCITLSNYITNLASSQDRAVHEVVRLITDGRI